MDIKKYFEKISEQSKEIFELTTNTYEQKLAKSHYLCTCIFDFSEEIIAANDEICALKNAISQLETSLYCLTIGLYRQANMCLRLGFELALGSIFFSTNKLEYLEWEIGKQDIRWSKLIDEENGVLSERFSIFFSSNLNKVIQEFNNRASRVYRRLSEFVHGNNETWSKVDLELVYNKILADDFFNYFSEVCEIILFTLSVRYLKKIEKDNLDFLITELSHIEEIRIYLGGPK
ncbi:hypothetical protein OK18_17535 [Chryseobacterium gallinarum]|uniref:Uncharacterized protein n=1 Tax=Chryseobacterium gallinarum TaxID=1324352 RepID=A0A0G3M6G2_CHRGL|nr:hypothetical protein [Chryseobacterium gallinarum]AKK74165.1 hypothetical protein OK18_17535 [Chryseobacterium gallinarum]